MHLYNDLESLVTAAGKAVRYADIEHAAQAVTDRMQARIDELTQIQMPVMLKEFTHHFQQDGNDYLKPYMENAQFLQEIQARYNKGLFELTAEDITRLTEQCDIKAASKCVMHDYRRHDLNKCLFLHHIADHSEAISIANINTHSWSKINFVLDIKTPNLNTQAHISLSDDDYELDASKMHISYNAEKVQSIFGFQFTEQQCQSISQFNEGEFGILPEVLDSECPAYSADAALMRLKGSIEICMSARALMLNPTQPDRQCLDQVFDKYTKAPQPFVYHFLDDLTSLTPQQYYQNVALFMTGNPMDTLSPTLDEDAMSKTKLPILRSICCIPLLDEQNKNYMEYLLHLNRLVNAIDEESLPGKYINSSIVKRQLREGRIALIDYEQCLNLSQSITECIESEFKELGASEKVNDEISNALINSL
ncbi:hypothetical protein [Shewanella aestuarii]|uniref:Uncharacterized protein n=1 Tax=Shewanella aestuarii TaxID=1028752 RepID=A0A6G9QQ72_9GAMM|nr:hypothetical protein [Shewanella aestuarii]QIR16568.1 hypothetical protein HBH39_19020 [Shewanella aestuarii]